MRRVSILFAATAATLIAGCSSKPKTIAVAPPIVRPTLPAPVAMPQPPMGAAANLVLPARSLDGRWSTPNSALSSAAAVWHLRSALNVAALGCRDADEPQTVANYNALLASKKSALASADTALRADYRTRFGSNWQDAHDDAMTKVYNFFAQPPVHAAFCAEAKAVLREMALVPADGFVAAAPGALARIEAPFLAFYDAYGLYQRELAAWQASQQPVVMAVSAPH